MFINRYQKDEAFRNEVIKQQQRDIVGQKGRNVRKKCAIPLDFRFAVEEDAVEVADLVNEAYNAVEKGDTGEAFKNCDCTSAAEVAESLKDGECRWYLAEARDRNETLLACCCFSLPPDPRKEGAAAQLRMLAVRPTHQSMKVGSHVLKCVESVIMSLGTMAVAVAVPSWRASVEAFVSTRGYTRYCSVAFPPQLEGMLTRPTTLAGFKKQLKREKGGQHPQQKQQKKKPSWQAKLSLSAPACPAAAAPPPAENPSSATAPPQAPATDAASALGQLSISSRNPDVYDEVLASLLENKPPLPPPSGSTTTGAGAGQGANQREPADAAFLAWQQEFGRKYKTREEREKRRGIWLANKKGIDAHNARFRAGKVDFEAEVNIFADLTASEYEQVQRMRNLLELGTPDQPDAGKGGKNSSHKLPNSLAELAKLGRTDMVDKRGARVGASIGPATRGPVMTELDSEAREDDGAGITKRVIARKEAEEEARAYEERLGVMANMSFEERKQYLIGGFKGGQYTKEELEEKMKMVLEEEQKRTESLHNYNGVTLVNNYSAASVLRGFNGNWSA